MPNNGDLIILTNPAGKRYLRRANINDDLHCNEGVLPMADVMAAEYGSIVRTRQGYPFKLMRPTLSDLVQGVKRQTQIIYPKDIGYICMRLGAGNGRKIIEAGTGSGSLTIALSWFSGENGRVCTYEARPEFHALARRNIEWAGMGHNVTMYNHDIANGFLDTDADALFLDVRTPWEYLEHAVKAVKPGAIMGFLLPTVDQVNTLLLALERGPFDDFEVAEILVRRWKPIADRLRPEDRMIAHTGFLVFARVQEQCEDWNSLRKLGTRERKQEAARLERMAAAENENHMEAEDSAEPCSDC